jgi:hypothetical protein
MKNNRYLSLLLIAAVAIFSSIVPAKANAGEIAKPTPEEKKDAPAYTPPHPSEFYKETSIKIKGVSLGMELKNAHDVLEQKLAGTQWKVSQVCMSKLSKKWMLVVCINPVSASNFDQALTMTAMGIGGVGAILRADEDGRVVYVNLLPGFVDDIFKASNMEAREFAEQFTSAYKIPEMNISEQMDSWTYSSPDGVKVTVDMNKKVLLEKTASEEERKSSFD